MTISLEETAFNAQTLVDKEKETHLYYSHEEQGPYSGKTYAGTVYKFEIVTFEGKSALKIYQAIAAPNDKECLGACATILRYEGEIPQAMASEFIRWEP